MTVDASNGLGLYSKLKLNVDSKTGQMSGTSDIFATAAEELYEAKIKTIDPIEVKKTTIDTKIEAMSNLQTLAKDLQTKSSVLFFTDAYGSEGIFSQMSASAASSTSVAATQVFDINTNPSVKDFTLQVTRTARYDVTTATLGVASSSSALGWTGDLTINGQACTITNTVTLTNVKDLINGYSDTTNVEAVIIKVSSTDYRLSLQASNTAEPITVDNSGLSGFTAGQTPPTSAETITTLSSEFIYDSITMNRTTNTVSDIVDGLTLTLKQGQPGTTFTVSLEPDYNTIELSIAAWATSVNTLIDEVAKHKQFDLESGTIAEESALYGTDILRSMDTLIRNNMAWVVNGGDPLFNYLGSIGLNVDAATGKIDVDAATLDAACKNDFQSVRTLFEYQNALSNSKFLISDHPRTVSNSIIVDNADTPLTSTITLNRDMSGYLTATITIDGGDYAGKTFNVANDKIIVTGDTIQFLGDDAIATGVTESPYAGFNFNFVGGSTIANGGSASTTLSITQGFADRFNGTLKDALDTDLGDSAPETMKTGMFALQLRDLNNDKDSLTAKIETITVAAEKLKEKFQKQISQMESQRQIYTAIMNAADAFLGMLTKK